MTADILGQIYFGQCLMAGMLQQMYHGRMFVRTIAPVADSRENKTVTGKIPNHFKVLKSRHPSSPAFTGAVLPKSVEFAGLVSPRIPQGPPAYPPGIQRL